MIGSVRYSTRERSSFRSISKARLSRYSGINSHNRSISYESLVHIVMPFGFFLIAVQFTASIFENLSIFPFFSCKPFISLYLVAQFVYIFVFIFIHFFYLYIDLQLFLLVPFFAFVTWYCSFYSLSLLLLVILLARVYSLLGSVSLNDMQPMLDGIS